MNIPGSNLKALIIPAPESERQNIHDDGHGVDDAHGGQFGLDGFEADDQNRETEKMEIAEKENQPDALKGQVPKGVFPDQMAADIEQAFDKNAEDAIADRPEPFLGQPENFDVFAVGQGVIVDDAKNQEHEHNFDVPADHGAQSGITRCCPEGGALRQIHHPTVPGFVEEIHAENGQPR